MVIAVKISMKRYLGNRIIPVLLSIFILPLTPGYLKAAISSPTAVSNSYQINQMISVSLKDDEQGTRVKVTGHDTIFKYATKTLDSPPRILVDIFAAVPTFETMTIPTKSRNLTSIRVGHHSKNIRIVLDIKGKDVPRFVVSSDREGLTVFIKSHTDTLPSMVLSPRQLGRHGKIATQLGVLNDQGGGIRLQTESKGRILK
ncbi:MAG: AMIN domain-containing protein [Deltaproteobacteria bacterium]|nr:AMIN domain-containing protein [Deltaproteobacteria bacterium]